MKTLNLILSAAITLLLLTTASALADEQAKQVQELPLALKEKEPQKIDPVFLKEKDQAQKLTNSLGMPFVKIPAGEFQMGITKNDAERLIQRRLLDWPLESWEKQVHKVKLTKGYYIGKHEVTVGQFRKFVEATKYETNAEDGFNAVRTTVIEGAITAGTWREPQFKQGEDHPVVCVTSVDAQRFINWLNKTDKKNCNHRQMRRLRHW